MKVTELAVARALVILKSLKAEYKIILPDGAEYGDLVIQPKKAKRQFKYPIGEMADHYRPFVKNMKPGEVVSVPLGKFEAEHLRGTMTGHFAKTWGAGSTMTTINKKAKTVEVLRIS